METKTSIKIIKAKLRDENKYLYGAEIRFDKKIKTVLLTYNNANEAYKAAKKGIERMKREFYSKPQRAGKKVTLLKGIYRPHDLAPDFPAGEYDVIKEYENSYYIEDNCANRIKLSKERFV